MSIGIAGKEGRAIAGAEDLLVAFRNEHDLPLQNVDELLRQCVPMPLTGPGPRRQVQQVDADLLQPCRYRQPTPDFILTRRGERLGIARTGRDRRASDIDLSLHVASPLEM